MIFLSPQVVDKTKFWKKLFSLVLSHDKLWKNVQTKEDYCKDLLTFLLRK